MAEDLVKLLAQHVVVGEPLPFDVLDLRSRLLLRQGTRVASEAQLERLLERGMYLAESDFVAHFGSTEADAPPEVVAAVLENAWMRLLALQSRLASWLEAALVAAPGSEGGGDRGAATAAAAAEPSAVLVQMARETSALCALDADAMLAAMTLLRHPSYCVRHSLCTALLAEMMLRRAPMSEDRRLSTIAGALVMNVAMFDLQDVLYGQREPLTQSQKQAIESHPTRALPILRAAGVNDEACLAVVARHHEHADGSGYPAGLSAPVVDLGCQAVALADRYCALIAERAYRGGAPSDQALKLLRERIGSTLEPVVVRWLVQEVGDHPPGCPVRLVNNESGIVLRRTRDPSSRVVKALRSPLNALYDDGPRRLTGQSAYTIDRVIKLGDLAVEIDPARLWGDTATIATR